MEVTDTMGTGRGPGRIIPVVNRKLGVQPTDLPTAIEIATISPWIKSPKLGV